MPSVQEAFEAAANGQEYGMTEWQEARSHHLTEYGAEQRNRDELVAKARKYREDCDDKNQEDITFNEGTWAQICADIEQSNIELKKRGTDYDRASAEVDRLGRLESGRVLTVGTDGDALMGEELTSFPENGIYNAQQPPMVRGGSMDQYMQLFPEAFKKDMGGQTVDMSAMSYRKAFHAYASAYHKNRVGPEVMNALVPFGDSGENYLYAPPQLLSLFLRSCDVMTFVRGLSTVITAPNVENTGIRKRTKKTSSFAWGCECKKPTADEPGFGLRTMQPHPYSMSSCLCRALLRRTTFNLEAFIADELARNASEEQENAFLNGDGVNKPLGVFTPSDDGVTLASDVETQSVGVLTADDLIYTWMKMPQCRRASNVTNTQSQTEGPVWIMHGDWLTQIMLLKSGDGQYIWRPYIRDGYPSQLLGRSVYESELAPNGTSSGDYVLALADMSDYYIVDGPRLGLERDDDIFTDQSCWVGRGYVDGAPIQEESFKRLKLQ